MKRAVPAEPSGRAHGAVTKAMVRTEIEWVQIVTKGWGGTTREDGEVPRRVRGAETREDCSKGGEVSCGWQITRGRLQKDLRRVGGLVDESGFVVNATTCVTHLPRVQLH